MKDRDGGPAFPVDRGNPRDPQGMSLHGYYAGRFAAAWVIALGARYKEPGYSDSAMMNEANQLGLEQADLMLAEKEKRDGK